METKQIKSVLAIALCSISLVGFVKPTQQVQASTTAKITLPVKHGYTRRNILKVNQGNIHAKNVLVKASQIGMKSNQYTDTDPADQRTINLKHLSKKDKLALSKFTLKLINQARHQLKQPNWTYSKHTQKFADRIAAQYTKHGRSCWDADHYVAGIERAAKASGLNSHLGNIYEDEAALPISSAKIMGPTAKMSDIKEGLYFNIKQMLYGGYYGLDYNDLSKYTEWEHAGDLLSARNNYFKHKQYALSFSFNKDPLKISTHFINVHKSFIQNYKKYNH